MAKIQYLSSSADLPSGGRYVLVEYGDENRLFSHSRGITVTVDRSMDANLLEAHTETAIGEAQAIAYRYSFCRGAEASRLKASRRRDERPPPRLALCLADATTLPRRISATKALSGR